MKIKSKLLYFLPLVLSGCVCLELQILKIPPMIFDPGFDVPGQYEVFADGALLTGGELGPDADLEWGIDEHNFTGTQALIRITDDIPRLIGVSGSSGWEDIEVLRDGEVVGKAIAQWTCTEPEEKLLTCDTTGEACTATLPLGDI